MDHQNFGQLFFTAVGFSGSSVDPPFQESNDHGQRFIIEGICFCHLDPFPTVATALDAYLQFHETSTPFRSLKATTGGKTLCLGPQVVALIIFFTRAYF